MVPNLKIISKIENLVFQYYDVMNVNIESFIFTQKEENDKRHVEMMGALIISVKQLSKQSNNLKTNFTF